MDYECLREKRFHEPSCMKKGGGGVKEKEKDGEGDIVEDGADGTHEKHKFFDGIDIPSSWFQQVFFIYVVGWNGYL